MWRYVMSRHLHGMLHSLSIYIRAKDWHKIAGISTHDTKAKYKHEITEDYKTYGTVKSYRNDIGGL